MVTKPLRSLHSAQHQFESCVVLDGDKTYVSTSNAEMKFESCVVLDGDKTRAGGGGAGCGLRVVLF